MGGFSVECIPKNLPFAANCPTKPGPRGARGAPAANPPPGVFLSIVSAVGQVVEPGENVIFTPSILNTSGDIIINEYSEFTLPAGTYILKSVLETRDELIAIKINGNTVSQTVSMVTIEYIFTTQEGDIISIVNADADPLTIEGGNPSSLSIVMLTNNL